MRILAFTLSIVLLGTPTYAHVCGDLDGDGTPTVLDALGTARAGAGMGLVVGDAFLRADVNSDGQLGILDALCIAQASAGVPTLLLCAFPPPPPPAVVEQWYDYTPVGGAQDLGQRCEHASVIDAPRNRAIFFSGFGLAGVMTDVWALDFSTRSWSQIYPTGSAPYADLNLKMAGDATRDRVLLFSGSDLVALDFSASSSGAWQDLGPLPAYAGPSGTADFDSAGNRAILVQGSYYARPGVFEIDFSTTPSGVSRFHDASGWLGSAGDIQGGIDRARNRYVLFEGFSGRVASLDLSTVGLGLTPVVAPLAPLGSCGVSRNMSMSDFDEVGDQLLIFGGTSTAESGISAVSFSGGADGVWMTLGAASPGPMAGSHPAIVFDGDDELFIHGGADLMAGGIYDRTWSFEIR